ncbi:hypothetical protein WUBG_15310, partial [Wuchereria bancrofti]
MAKQISDVIHQTLTGTTRNSVNSTDNNDNDNDCNGDNMLQQIRKIIEYDA